MYSGVYGIYTQNTFSKVKFEYLIYVLSIQIKKKDLFRVNHCLQFNRLTVVLKHSNEPNCYKEFV